jgi:uncharacterized protein YqeY
MPSLLERLNADLKDAMRAGDATRRDEIRGVLAMLRAEQQAKLTRTLSRQGLILHGENATLSPEQQTEVDRLRATSDLSPDEEQAVLLLRVKQHRQSIEGFLKGNRADLVQLEEAQLAIDEGYLPQQLDNAGIEAAIQAALTETAASESSARPRRHEGRRRPGSGTARASHLLASISRRAAGNHNPCARGQGRASTVSTDARRVNRP